MTIAPPEIKFVTTQRVACDGDEGPLGHPRVYLNMGTDGRVVCGYCDRLFILEGGPADTPEVRAEAEKLSAA
ncbi:zinc-finger domain-containing protein [Eilatimonas milleporae]|uniref:Zinc finger protein n=1 Tax=Eilatimonas milleporae TaxID=911205 RepID=A0A3M0C067_9PROT|nr:zinc-finger domain-containing protein [Eilatimonas milleporae]RMB02017.1 zinc finger protein [Eilatimonas milleporae]